MLWKLVQQESFGQELKDLKAGRSVSSNSTIVTLSPFLDSNGVMRAKGRLSKSNLSYDMKHPVILPSKHRVIEMYLNYKHKSLHHEGVEYLRSLIQRENWILGLRNALRSVKHKCL